MVHSYNQWLPEQVAYGLDIEPERFHRLVGSIEQTLKLNTFSAKLDSLQWISVVNTFMKAKSTLVPEDVENLANAALDIILRSSDSLYIQARWANCLAHVLQKYRKKIKLEIDWRPLYTLLLKIHFERSLPYEGLMLKHSHLQNLVYLIETCRRFFKGGSCAEIWTEFRPKLEDISHNCALEAAGFISLFFSPTSEKRANGSFFTRNFVAECLELWSAIPTSHYWNIQWASLLSRCIKHRVLSISDWEPFLPKLFTNFLNAFEVPVGKSGVRSPIYRRVPAEIKHAFHTNWSPGLSTLSAKSIVYLLSPRGSTQSHFDTMVEFLEQYYHPSNGGSWTGSLQRFLRLLVFYFMKRLQNEHRETGVPNGGAFEDFLGQTERTAFVRTVMKLIERGQYSKNNSLAWTAASAASRLAYVEPSLVLPMVVSRFQTALETVTATHQLESALRMLALSSRPILLYDEQDNHDSVMNLKTCLADAMFNTLPGLDANDPPKTIATMQFYCSVISSVGRMDCEGMENPSKFPLDWYSWVDEFLDRLFTLLVKLDPSIQPQNEESSQDGFLTERGSPYPCLLELLFGKLPDSEFKKALKRIQKFVIGNILPGAVGEVGLLCCNIVSANPDESSNELLVPIMENLIALFSDSPKTGFGENDVELPVVDFKVGLSPALEMTTKYFLGVLSKAIFYGGSGLSTCKSLLQQVISAAFDAPSSKVNDAGCNLLTVAIGSMALYYPSGVLKSRFALEKMDGDKEWKSVKSIAIVDKQGIADLWHMPSREEVAFVEQIVDAHLNEPLKTLKRICDNGYRAKYAGQEKEHLRVLLLRLEGALCGLGSCLPDLSACACMSEADRACSLTIIGAVGATIGTSEMRQEAANVVHQVSDYILKNRGDDSVLLKILVSVIDLVGNYGSVEYHAYLHMKGVWDENSRLLTEPCTNFITKSFSSSKRRPWWFIVERAFIHNLWRASQSHYRCYKENEIGLSVSPHVVLLLDDLLKLSLHSYNSVRLDAGRNLKNMLQRYPVLVKKCIPLLTKTLQDPKATKEAALGSCEILMSRPVIRHLRQDWAGLTSFFVGLLGSAHHESVEAQDAINELFIVFNTSFGGVPVKEYVTDGDGKMTDVMTYTNMISYVKDLLKGDSITIHWRYNLMAHGILLFLVLPVTGHEKSSQDAISDLRYSVTGGFLKNLKSELPPLRPLSVIALLFLLEATPHWDIQVGEALRFSAEQASGLDSKSLLNSMANLLDDQKFGEHVVNKLAIDRQSGEEDEYSLQRRSDGGITSFMPTYMREWPHTRTWDNDMQGQQFSPTFAKLFKRLVQKFGSIVLNVLHGPLDAVTGATDDKGKQCIAAEIMAGLLHSDTSCVIAAWDEWISSLFQKFLVLPTLDSASEWAACVRFAVGGKGQNGSRVPILRSKVLECVARCVPEKSSSTLLARKLMFLRAALVELLPAYSTVEEITFQSGVLKQVLGLQKHSSPQVRRHVGNLLSILLSNLHLFTQKHRDNGDMNVEKESENACRILVNDSMEATKKIINAEPLDKSQELSVNEGDDERKKRLKEFVRQMETMMYLLISAILSGRADALMNVIIELIYPTLSLQETSENELSSLARVVMRLMQWQPFPLSKLSHVVEVLLTAAEDSNWHTRVAFCIFLQAFVYRHRFVLSTSDHNSLWVKTVDLVSDPQLEVREAAAKTLSGMMKGAENTHAKPFRERVMKDAALIRCKKRNGMIVNKDAQSIPKIHGVVLGLSAIILSVPYDMPRWLPDIVTELAEFSNYPWPIRGTVTKTIRDFRHTHSDMWEFQKESFTEQQLEVTLAIPLFSV
ncbi:hypothetical protein KP509_17G047600 [Ceratopteris richardii]|uniref:Proteasome activator subunit 4 n=2 Tax=Ceratopteris richardii TaxID=49495 RepID=A0A8T2STW3_CERRI|nr:hypothetical protein KP509_17G047600 [Ceratopteris richardii]